MSLESVWERLMDGCFPLSFSLSPEVNECLQFGACSQYCTNTKGSYKCTCDRNFKEIDGECITKGINYYCLIQIDIKEIQYSDILFHFYINSVMLIYLPQFKRVQVSSLGLIFLIVLFCCFYFIFLLFCFIYFVSLFV